MKSYQGLALRELLAQRVTSALILLAILLKTDKPIRLSAGCVFAIIGSLRSRRLRVRRVPACGEIPAGLRQPRRIVSAAACPPGRYFFEVETIFRHSSRVSSSGLAPLGSR